ncbi:unnamed protein product [Linum tenue]|uniref:Uncharacterized protein n=2 Tax=Linum tenue TaxID=586396 RepID=A0AAV0R5L8_9ROSI|nr:unnamed protein product [Linum tenue]
MLSAPCGLFHSLQPPLPLLLAAMNHVVLSKLAWTDKSPAVKLRLLHTWMAGNPSRPDGFSEYATLWTDELGVLVQGLASKLLSDQLKEVLSVGKIYFVTQFSQREAKKRWAPCSNDRLLHFTSSTTFVLADEDASSFCADSFEFRRFEDLHGIASRAEHLVDAVGRLVSATPVTYFQKQHRSIKKQTVVIENERGASLPVTLWAEFADRLPLAQLIQLDGAAPIVVAFTSLNLSLWREIEDLVGKEYIFLLYLPVGQVSDSMADMVVSSIEKDEQPASIDRQPHGPRFQKRHSTTIATVPQLMPPRSTNYIQHAPSNSSDITVFASPTKRLRDVSPSTSMVDDPVSQEHTEFRAPRPVQTLDMRLSSPLAGINIATPSSSEKKKDKLSDTAHVEPHQLLSRPADIAITAAAGLGNTSIHEKPLPSAALLKDIPPSMLPINPLSHPLAKVKVEKLQYSRKDAKNSKDSDTLPISHLKTKVSKGKGVAKKLFQG